MQLQSIWILYAHNTNIEVCAPYCRRNAQCKICVTGNRARTILTGNMISPIKGRKQVKVVREYGAEEHSWAWERETERESKGILEKTAYWGALWLSVLQQIVLGLPNKPDEIEWACIMHEEEDKHNLLVTESGRKVPIKWLRQGWIHDTKL